MAKPINYIVEVDIQKFFDTVDHTWLMKCLQERIADENLLWIIRKQLKAGVMESGQWKETEEGTPQGGVISPVLANIYLHYVLDLWFEVKFKPAARGYVQLIRYCDDFVVACESEQDAKTFLAEVEERLAKFGLKISPEKTQIIKFGRQAWKNAQRTGSKAATFNFLGFTHYCGKTRNGAFSMRHKTSKQNLARKLKNFKEWLKSMRNAAPLKDWWKTISAKLIGHYNYFGVSGNIRSLSKYYQRILWMLFKWINRRSQKKSLNYGQFMKYLQWNPLPTPRIQYALWENHTK
jgi:group II intron reverse transcriptase/maturase